MTQASIYTAYLVGKGPRIALPDQGVTSDMCIPIHPTIDDSSGRPALRTDLDFPFAGYYQWTGIDMRPRVRVRLMHDVGLLRAKLLHPRGTAS